jgi:DNA-3-methyladenine glycosylase II
MNKLEFRLNDRVLKTLSSSDKKMAMLIHSIGDYELNLRTDYFLSLVRSIIGQQLSVSAAGTIWQRMLRDCKNIRPEVLISKKDDELRALGISRTKVTYMKDLSQKILSGELNLNLLTGLADQEVIEQLVKIKGIGVWTAEMFLIFSLGRMNVFSIGDVGLKRAIQWLYESEPMINDEEIMKHAKKWVPYRSVASLYLWEIINRGLIKSDPGNLKPKT